MSLFWFFLALGAGLGDSWSKASQKWAVSVMRYSKPQITFWGNLIASAILFSVSYFFIGLPVIKEGFWTAILITGILNAITFPMLLRAYEIGEFSSVYSMILLTPVFLFLTSFLFLGERPSLPGVFGVFMIIFGLYIIAKQTANPAVPGVAANNPSAGNFLGIMVALIWSVSVNFDKLSTLYSNQFFAPAAVAAIVSAGAGIYMILGKIFRGETAAFPQNSVPAESKTAFFSYLILAFVGVALAASNVFHNAALLYGPATYTIAVKRTGILWGVFWGWMFFRENNLSGKIAGSLLAVAGVFAILFA